MSSAASPNLALVERFASYRTLHNGRFFEAVADYLAEFADDPSLGMYFDYAISANDRGRFVAGILAGHANLAGASYLDVGCAYAGFLVGFAERGARVCGVELSERLIAVARANLADHGLDAEVIQADATVPLFEHASRYDLITCNDVIEHVEDPLRLVQNIALMLRESGLAYFEIPNRNHPRFVLADGHFGMFGITLLGRGEAEGYFRLVYPQRDYGVGYYLELDQYAALFKHCGLTLTLLAESFDGVLLETILADAQELRRNHETLLAGVPDAVRPKLAARLSDYLHQLEATPYATDEQRQPFVTFYGPGFWRVIARKG